MAMDQSSNGTVEATSESAPAEPVSAPPPSSRLPAWIQFPRRLVLLVLAFFLSTLAIFLLLNAAPGGPLSHLPSGHLSVEDYARMEQFLGLDQPLAVRYLRWLGNMLTLNWGDSWITARQNSVSEVVMNRLPNSLVLVGAALMVGAVLSLLATLFATLIHRLEEKAGTPGSILKALGRLWIFPQAAVPAFWLGLMMLILFTFKFKEWGLPYLPAGGAISLQGENAGGLMDRIVHLIMPTVALSLYPAILTAQAFTRALTLPNQGSGCRIWLARLLRWGGLILGQTGGILGVMVLVELLFAYPGIGHIFFQAAVMQDLPVVGAILLALAALVGLGRLGAELFRWLERLMQGEVAPRLPEPTSWRRRARTTWVIVGLATLVIPMSCLILGLMTPLLAPSVPLGSAVTRVGLLPDPYAVDPPNRFLNPGEGGHLLGTDEVGRDVLARLLLGGRTSLGSAALIALVVVVLGGLGGALTGWLTSLRKAWAESVSDLLLLPADALLLIPLVPCLTMVGVTFAQAAPAPPTRMFILALGAAMLIAARAVRAYQTLWLAAPEGHKLWTRLLAGPGAIFLGGMFVGLSSVAALDFLGFGVRPPAASWGNMLSGIQNYIFVNPTLAIWPGLLLWVCLLAIYTAADALAGYFATKEIMVRFNE